MNSNNRQSRLPLLLPVFIITLVCSLIIYATDMFTRDRIELNKQLATIKMIETVFPLAHDNDLFEDKMEVAELSSMVYRARQGDLPVGLVFMPLTANGYKGKIKLAMAVSYDGILSGVRIIEHNETEGLGDGIDQSKSDWIFNFDNRSLVNTANEAWAVKSDGGDFDQLSGATISPRALINAVKDTLDYYKINRDNLYK
jgi:H+/Na+-translocating ferredoxin:NAD+ oxidoreductase subunit G